MALGGLTRAVLLDGLGTLLALDPPAPVLCAGLRREHGIELTLVQAERAFAAEIEYYRAHHHEGRDGASLATLHARCGEVLHAALPAAIAQALSVQALTAAMLGSLRFSAYPDALATLPLLRARGMALVVVSNWDVSLAAVLRDTGLAEMLDGVLTSAQVARPKPAPEIFSRALELVGVAPHEALHVGDMAEHDVVGARAAGVNPVLLCRERAVAEPRGGAGASPQNAATTQMHVPTISSLAELPGLL